MFGDADAERVTNLRITRPTSFRETLQPLKAVQLHQPFRFEDGLSLRRSAECSLKAPRVYWAFRITVRTRRRRVLSKNFSMNRVSNDSSVVTGFVCVVLATVRVDAADPSSFGHKLVEFCKMHLDQQVGNGD